MLTPLHELWRARRGRRAAVALIRPLVSGSRRRLDEIPDPTWYEPYMVGFLVMLITLTARRSVKALSSQALARVQCEAWAEITGMKPELIGEEVLHLSAAENGDFLQGCRDAGEITRLLEQRQRAGGNDLLAALSVDLAPAPPPIADDGPVGIDLARVAISDLWEHYFESRVVACRDASAAAPGRPLPLR